MFPSDLSARLWNGVCLQQAPDTIVWMDDRGHQWRVDDIRTMVHQWRTTIRAYRLPKGARVIVDLPRSLTTVVALLACWDEDLCVCPCPVNESTLTRLHPHAVITCSAPDDVSDSFANASSNVLPSLDITRTYRWIHRHNDPVTSVLSYMITTSGSTGVYKIVMSNGNALPTLWDEQARAFDVTHDSRMGWMLSWFFDASLSDLGVALTHASLLFVFEATPPSPKQWRAAIDRHLLTHIDAPPAFLNTMRRDPPPASLRTVIAGGEVTPPDILRAWTPFVRWVNVYGPTEATVCTSLCVRRPTDDFSLAPVGKPLSGVAYALWDTIRGPIVPTEPCEGELCIAGPLAQGYWGDPDKTTESFVWHRETLWYLTGDWVRWTPEQGYVFLSRMGRMVKYHGRWILLDEIEDGLRQDPSIQQVAVVARDMTIEAFVCSEAFDEQRLTWKRQYPMISTWHRRETLPMNNGKIARGLL